MARVEELKRAIDAVQDLQSIVRTMKALAAVSIRQYEKALESLVDYTRTVEMGLHIVLRGRPQLPVPRKAAAGRLGAVVFGSDHGLCGRFNEDVTAFAIAKMNGFHVSREDRRVLAVGARADISLESAGHLVEECFFVPGSAAGVTATVRQVLMKIDEWRTAHDVVHVLLFYNTRRERANHQPVMLHLSPLNPAWFRRLAEQRWPSRSLPAYTMERDVLFSALIREYFFISVFRACAESLASEHASRLDAMEAAEKNIQDRLQGLGIRFRQQRQDAITEELLDVVAGFEVLTEGTSD